MPLFGIVFNKHVISGIPAHSSLTNVSCFTSYDDQSWSRVFISPYRFTIGFKLGICVEQSLIFLMVFKGYF